MSALGIANVVISQLDAFASHGRSHQLQQGFQQLAQDLQAGDLSQAQSDFTSLQQLSSVQPHNLAVTPASSPQRTDPLATAVSQLARDLQSHNLSVAKHAYASLQQEFLLSGFNSAGFANSPSANLRLSA